MEKRGERDVGGKKREREMEGETKRVKCHYFVEYTCMYIVILD